MKLVILFIFSFFILSCFYLFRKDGTIAAKSEAQIPMQERRRRSTHLRSLSASKRMDWHSEHCGKDVRVLLENPKGEYLSGYTDNYLKVMVRSQSGENANHFATLKIKSAKPEFCVGEILRVEK